jgi:hypothetical protein
MTALIAKKIGRRQGLIFSVLGVLIAQLIIVFMIGSNEENLIKKFFWFNSVNYKFNLLIVVLILVACGFFYGQIAGSAILFKKRHFVLVGFLTGLATLLTTAFLCGWTGFFQEGSSKIGMEDDPFEDYILKPFYWVSLYGLIPSGLVGIWLGKQIELKGRKYNS